MTFTALFRSRPRPAEVRTFTVEPLAGTSPPVVVTGTRADTYHPCRRCPGRNPDDSQTVTTYRVSSREIPWWLTAHIHACSGGHAELVVHRTPALISPAPTAPQRSGYASFGDRSFELRGTDRGQRTTLLAVVNEVDRPCRVCLRPYGVTHHRLADGLAPAWLGSIELLWCKGCGHGHLEPGWIPRAVHPHPVAPGAAR
ncbi:hypothetical protein [Nocardia transvalensis]|uniref:hypothetical protein n=1 Tax=Nocardia transvalensis TaxID=37333 RepID=UPI0018939486|nr:hypothetical protein [Nocardia transvalensis]MBF6333217.1 hypothetical protein [Nocardia transvalensis]